MCPFGVWQDKVLANSTRFSSGMSLSAAMMRAFTISEGGITDESPKAPLLPHHIDRIVRVVLSTI
ncbi:hypothetical protein MAR_013077 [Mya arenaria]|uniref:Uncharacterized protein n=1 Tax=Mya arenaria TaxID=6604 RepID=A0ABY7FYU5_MYAAR|nr:hypothetical protein MAR_013077 [Mya arenaria]